MYNRVQMFWSARLELSKSTEWHSHEVLELVYCTSGAGSVLVGDRPMDLRPNRLVLIAPETRHRFLFEESQSASLKIVCMTSQDQAMYLSPVQVGMLDGLRSSGCAFSDGPAGEPIVRQLVNSIPEGTVVGDRQKVLMAWGIVGLVLASQADICDASATGKPHGRREEKMVRICEWLLNHLPEEINLDDIASTFALSRSLLTRSFRRHTGTSIVEYLNTRRLERAAVLLTSAADESIARAAMDCGFSNLSHFHRCFKSAYGLTPAEFRRNFSER